LAFLLARQDLSIEVEDQEYIDIFNSTHLSKHFLALAKELDVLEPKLPNDIYKTHLENNFGSSGVDSASQNLASTFTNAFVNAAFCSDKLITNTEDSNVWVYKHKDHGKVSAVAALGMIYLWDVETGLAQIDRYMYSNDDYTKAGALLGIGILTNRTKSENDPAFALLSEYVYGTNNTTRIGAIAGLGIAHAGSNHADLVEHLLPLVTDTTVSMEISSMAALSIGMICVGSLNGEVTSSILQTFMEREDAQLKDTHARFMGLGLALLCLGRQDASEPILEALKTISHPLSDLVYVMVLASSFAGTGNVLKVQEMLHICNDHLDKEKEDDQYQAFAVLGVALIAMGEEVGSEMAMRTFSHLMHYGEPVIRRAVPLAIALECTSNPTVPVLDTLSKYSHDNDVNVAINAIFALGLVGAGTNNARLAQMLRQLASYYHKDPNCLFMVRVAQGLLHMGKGTLSATPSHSDRNLLSPTALSGLLVTLTALTDANNTIFANSHYFLYYLVTAIYPRFLITLDESLEPLPTTVRVGQAVDVVGQAGRPKTITGFQTHSTPVLLAYSERAELATEEYISCSHILESFVILKKNPDYKDEKDD
jgi:26S proteasome regulatory subunit N1